MEVCERLRRRCAFLANTTYPARVYLVARLFRESRSRRVAGFSGFLCPRCRSELVAAEATSRGIWKALSHRRRAIAHIFLRTKGMWVVCSVAGKSYSKETSGKLLAVSLFESREMQARIWATLHWVLFGEIWNACAGLFLKDSEGGR